MPRPDPLPSPASCLALLALGAALLTAAEYLARRHIPPAPERQPDPPLAA